MAGSHVTPTMHAWPSELGWLALAWSGERLTRITLGHQSAMSALASLAADLDIQIDERQPQPTWIEELASRLQAFAGGQSVTFSDVALDLAHLSDFQTRVARACRRIGRGQVRTYGELAALAGNPGAARAVGSTMAKNRFPVIVPCHRVVAAGGALGGFSARDGLNLKQRMLALEGVQIQVPRKNRQGALL